MDTPESRLKVLQSESQLLTNYLDNLASEAWDRPSACDRWLVRDVVAHLAGGAQGYAATVSRGLQGESPPPETGRPGASPTAASGSEGIAQGAIDRRESLGDDLLSEFKKLDGRLNELLAGLGPDDWGKPCHFLGLTLPVSAFIDLRMTEMAMHSWDIQSKLEPSARLSPETLPSFIDAVSIFAGWLFWPGTGAPTPARYRFQFTEPAFDSVDILLEGDNTSIEEASTGPADIYLRSDAETYVFLMYGRLRVDSAIEQGRLSVEGDRSLASQLGRRLGGM